VLKLKRWREGAQVERCHTVKHIGTYSVGEHSHGVALIILALHPRPSHALLRAAILHDLHEVHTGDIPAFAKTREIKMREQAIDAQIGTDVRLEESELRWLRGADLLECLLWAREQRQMGNRNVARIEEHVFIALSATTTDIPAEIRRQALEYKADRSWPIGAK
tara:strand:+ start:64 stop:555 length:492 start_codon:yes stop_codon:yes gene_type:complete